MVFDRDGNFLRGFGKGIFSNRTHGILIGPDDTVYCADDGIHTITKFTRDGELLMTIGTPGQEGLGMIRQGFLEASNVDVVKEMVDLITAQRAYEINSKMVTTSEDMLQIANNLKR